ncbi:MAG: hypothetical protein ACYS4W_00360 [Planctomycetota bacterium]
MKSKILIIAVLAGFGLLAAASSSKAVSQRDIENVRNKSVLDRTDFEKIDTFVDEAVHELVRTRELASISKLRTVILQNAASNKPSAKAQYATQFYESAYKRIRQAFQEAQELPTDERRFVVTVSLLILVDGLLPNAPDSPKLVGLALERLKDDNMVIRYWAVRITANPEVVKRLNSGNSELAQRIAEQLSNLVESSCPEIIALIAEFGGGVNAPEAESLLLQIADMRIRGYADWTVEQELLEDDVLKALCRKISSGGPNNPSLARRFGQLYSYAVQRYIMGRNHLSETQKRQLGSVLVETEDKCIRNLLAYQVDIKKALEQNDYRALQAEHDELFAKLARKYKYTYVDRNGKQRPTPSPLREPPVTRTSE